MILKTNRTVHAQVVILGYAAFLTECALVEFFGRIPLRIESQTPGINSHNLVRPFLSLGHTTL